MLKRWIAVFGVVVAACGGGVEGDEGETEDALGGVIWSSAATPAANAIVSITFGGRRCSGTLVRADLVLTTKSCLGGADYTVGGSKWRDLGSPGYATVFFGPRLDATIYRVRAERWSYAGSVDLALLAMNVEVPATMAVPRAIATVPPLSRPGVIYGYSHDTRARSFAYVDGYAVSASEPELATVNLDDAAVGVPDLGAPMIPLSLRDEASPIGTDAPGRVAGVVIGVAPGQVILARTDHPTASRFIGAAFARPPL